ISWLPSESFRPSFSDLYTIRTPDRKFEVPYPAARIVPEDLIISLMCCGLARNKFRNPRLRPVNSPPNFGPSNQASPAHHSPHHHYHASVPSQTPIHRPCYYNPSLPSHIASGIATARSTFRSPVPHILRIFLLS